MKQRQTIESLKHRRALLNALIFFFVTAVVWVGFAILRSQTVTKLPENMSRLATPLNPNIDLEVVTRIGAKRSVTIEDSLTPSERLGSPGSAGQGN